MKTFFDLFASYLLIAFLTGCCLHTRSTPEQIVAHARERVPADDNHVNILWYQGTENGYDYFRHVHGMFQQSCFRVAEGRIEIPTRFPRTDDDSRWLMVPKIGDFEFKSYPERWPGP